MIKRALAVLAVSALPLSLALTATPAQAVTGSNCGDGANWDWKISNPARYQASNHEAVVGLSEAKRTVTILAPTGCTFNVGDDWRVYNGYFSAEGTITQAEVDAPGDLTADSDVVNVEVPSSNSVAGDDIGVHLKVNNQAAATAGWEVDKYSSVAPLNLLRRSLFKYHNTDNRINFSEPYDADQPIRSGGELIRASWSSHAYFGYEGRPVHIQWRADTATSTYEDVQVVTTGSGGTVRATVVVADSGGPNPGDTFILRAKYNGNGTTSGNWSTGDRVAPAS